MVRCAVCGTRNGNDATFCAACGARLMESSRATVSTLIVDPPERLHLTAPEPVCGPHLALVAGRPELVVSRTGAALTVFPLQSRAAIGRSSQNDVVLREANVSRSHAVLSSDGDRWFVEDCNSRAGTTVAGERLTGRRALQDGDEIEIGEFVFQVRTAWSHCATEG